MDLDECVVCKVFSSPKHLIIANIYRNYENLVKDQKIIQKLDELLNRFSDHDFLVMGDFNEKQICWERGNESASNPFGESLLEVTLSNGLEQIVDSNTRTVRADQEPSLLDLVFTSDIDTVSRIFQDTPISDHNLIVVDLILNLVPDDLIKSRKLNYRKADWIGIRSFLKSIDWTKLFQGELDNDLHKLIAIKDEAESQFIPLTSPIKLKARLPRHLEKLSRKKKCLWQKIQCLRKFNSHSEPIFAQYKSCTSELRRQLRHFDMQKEEQLLSSLKSNPKHFHSHVKKVIGKDREKIRIKIRDKFVSDEEACEEFSKTFRSVYEMSSNLVWNEQQPVFEKFWKDEDLLDILKTLNVNKSPGSDGFSPIFVKSCAEELIVPLNHLFKLSLVDGKLASDWLIGKIIPIHKSGSKFSTNNYRPITLVSLICKILEKLIRKEIETQLDLLGHRFAQQHGFVRRRNTFTNLITTYGQINSWIRDGESVDMIFYDFSKAFDKMVHSKLVAKLKHIGISALIRRWIFAFLTSRQSRVTLNGKFSNFFQVTSGAPQGSTLGPLLFRIFCTDLLDGTMTEGTIFADDLKTFHRISKLPRSVGDSELQLTINKIRDWSTKWSLPLNQEKCVHIQFGKSDSNNYHLFGTPIKKVFEHRDLGLKVNSQLSWSSHISQVVSCGLRRVGLLRHVFKNLDIKSFKLLYKTYVRPLLEVNSSIWSPFLKKDIERLETVQKRAIRMVNCLRGQQLSYDDKLRILDLPSLQKRRRRGDLIETFKILRGFYDVDANGLFKFGSEFVDRRTRTNHNYKLARYKANLDRDLHFFTRRIVNDWNNLSSNTVDASTVDTFKSRLDNELFLKTML